MPPDYNSGADPEIWGGSRNRKTAFMSLVSLVVNYLKEAELPQGFDFL